MADNLLDKASILLTPTAYNDGSMLSVKPENGDGDFTFSRGSAATRVNAQGLVENVQIISSELVSNGNFSQEGSELVTNGDFATDSDWTKLNATISNGKGNLDGDGQTSLLYQNILTQNKSYKVTFTVSNYNGLGEAIIMSNFGVVYYYITANGTFSAYFQHTVTDGNFLFRARNGTEFSIDNVSVKEVGQDWTLGGDFETDGTKAFINNASQYSQLTNQLGVNYLLSGRKYRLSLDIPTLSISGAFAYRYTGGSVIPIESSDIQDGKFTTEFTMPSNGYFWLQTTGSYTGLNVEVDNISVKEITDDTDLPRIDYTDGCGSWLLEPQSTNLVTDSQNYNSNYWSGQRGILSDGGVGLFYLSPNSNVIKYEVNQTQYNQMYYRLPSGVTIGNTYTQQGYVKCNDASYIHFQISTLSGNPTIVWDNVNNTVISADSSIDSYNITSLNDGWVKAEITYTASVSSIYASLKTYFSTSSTTNWAGVPVGTIAYQTFVQVEQQSYATSYIPTNGATNTRLQDIANNSGNSTLINSTEGVLYAEIAALADDNTNRYITISDGSNSNYIRLVYSTTSNQLGARYYVNGSFQCALVYILTDETEFIKAAFKWKENDFALWVNGTEVANDTSGNVNPENTFYRLDFSRYDGIFPFNGKAKSLAVFPILTNAQLQSLTTQ